MQCFHQDFLHFSKISIPSSSRLVIDFYRHRCFADKLRPAKSLRFPSLSFRKVRFFACLYYAAFLRNPAKPRSSAHLSTYLRLLYCSRFHAPFARPAPSLVKFAISWRRPLAPPLHYSIRYSRSRPLRPRRRPAPPLPHRRHRWPPPTPSASPLRCAGVAGLRRAAGRRGSGAEYTGRYICL